MPGPKQPPDTPLVRAVEHALELLERLRAHPAGNKKRTPPIDTIRSRLFIALARDDTASPERDGLNRGAGGRQPGPGDDVKLTSIEAAALTRQQRDAHHEHTHRAATDLIAGILKIANTIATLDKIDRVITDEPIEPEACESCERTLTAPRRWEHRSTVGDRLDRVHRLCRPCIAFTEDHARLPTEEELRHHDTTGRWRVRSTV